MADVSFANYRVLHCATFAYLLNALLVCQVASGCAVGNPVSLCVAMAPGGARSSISSFLRPRRAAVRTRWGAGAPGRAPLGAGPSAHVCEAKGGR